MREITPEMMLIHLERQTIWWREIRSMEQSNKVGSRFPVKLNLTFRNSICRSQLNGFDATISLSMIWCYLHLEIHWQRRYHWWNPLQSLEQDMQDTRESKCVLWNSWRRLEFSSIQFFTYSFLLFISSLRIFVECSFQI